MYQCAGMISAAVTMSKTTAAGAVLAAGGGGFGLPMGGGGLGIGAVIVLGLVGWALGIDPSVLISGAEIVTGGNSQYQRPGDQSPRRTGAPTDDMGKFVAGVLGKTEDVWT